MAEVTKTDQGSYRVSDSTQSGYVDRCTSSVTQYMVTYWKVDESANEFLFEKALYGWNQSNELEMQDESAPFLRPYDFYFPTNDEKLDNKLILGRAEGKRVISSNYYIMRRAIGRHRKALMVHLKLIEPPVKKEKTKFIMSWIHGGFAHIVHEVETAGMIGTYRKNNTYWVPWTHEKEILMHAYNMALEKAQEIKKELFAKTIIQNNEEST